VRRREAWFEGQVDLDPERVVSIDETWASTNMARRYGRAPKAQRLRVGVPHGHWKTTTFVAGLRINGMVAPMVLDGPINGVAFQAYVEPFLVAGLKPGDIVIVDNLGSHKGAAVRSAIEAAGARLLYFRHTVPTSIRLRTPSQRSKPSCERPPNEPSTACGNGAILQAFRPTECANYFAAAGYDAT
jgi:transposase